VKTQHNEAKQYAAKVGITPISREAHQLIRNEYPAPWEDDHVPSSYKGRLGIYKSKRFVAHMEKCKLATKRAWEKVGEEENDVTQKMPSNKKPRRSERAVTPD